LRARRSGQDAAHGERQHRRLRPPHHDHRGARRVPLRLRHGGHLRCADLHRARLRSRQLRPAGGRGVAAARRRRRLAGLRQADGRARAPAHAPDHRGDVRRRCAGVRGLPERRGADRLALRDRPRARRVIDRGAALPGRDEPEGEARADRLDQPVPDRRRSRRRSKPSPPPAIATSSRRRSARRCGSASASPSSTSSAGSTPSSTTRRRSSSSRASGTAPRSSGRSGWVSSTCC
jgi:hypothetical protein